MKVLEEADVCMVSGGGEGLREQVADACKGQPDSANVTVTVSSSGNIGGAFGKVLGGAEASDSMSITVNCGEFREEQAKKNSN
ncbi:hypothetical protein [Pseudoxanthomonas jiangsuensis]|uniref:hypothetical protein n=1 Tax=Pseudoxanthomonas jiangsuensis TaxID=619688 RepID=UPI001391D69C|nr:hypothetical protein [Pseudoxanthomonas jiangsuensis]